MNNICWDYLQELLLGKVSDELISKYGEILDVLDAVNFTSHIGELERLYHAHVSQNVDVEEIPSLVDSLIREAVDTALTMIGVAVDESMPVRHLAELADTLLNFDPTTTPQFLLHALEDSDDPVDAVIQILVLLGTYEYEDWLPFLVSVEPSVVRRMTDLCRKEAIQAEVENTPLSEELRRRAARVVSHRPDTAAGEMVKNGTGIGVTFENLYVMKVGELIHKPKEVAAEDIVSLAAISAEGAGLASFEAAVNFGLDDLFYDPMERARIEPVKSKLMDEYRTIIGV